MSRRLLVSIQALGLRALLAFVWDTGVAAAQTPELSVVAGGHNPVQVVPGQVLTVPFRIGNAGGPVRLSPEVMVPEGWRAMAGTHAMAVAPQSSGLWLVSVGVPSAATAGRHSIPLHLRVDGEQRPFFSDTLHLDVKERPRVQVRILNAPSYAIGGDTVMVRYLLHNLGNAPARLRVELETNGTLHAAQPDSLVTLGPGDFAEQTAVLRATKVEQSQAARLQVLAFGTAWPEVRDSVSAEVVVVPTSTSSADVYHHLPVRLRLRAGEGGGYAPMLGELSGGGQLLDGRGPQVFFNLRSSQGGGVLSHERDQYSLSLRGSAYGVDLGDQVFETGTLAGGGRRGFGAGGSVTYGQVQAGGFVSTSRDWAQTQSARSAYVSYRAGGVHEFTSRVSALSGGQSQGGTLASLAYASSPYPGADVQVEYGVSRSPQGPGQGYAVDLRGDHGWLRYSLEQRSGDRNLPGQLQGVHSTSASLALSPLAGLTLGGSAYNFRHSPIAVPFAYSNAGRSLNLHADFRGVAGIEYQAVGSAFSFGSGAMHQQSEVLRLRWGVRSDRIGLQATAEVGDRYDPVSRAKAPYIGYGVLPMLSLGRAVMSGYARLDLARGNSVAPGQGWSLGGTLSGQVTQRLRVFLAASDHASSMVEQPREQQLEVRLDQELAGQHMLSLRLQHFRMPSFVGETNRASLEYTVPLRLRTSRARAPGRVVGRVVDGQSGTGVGGVLVRLHDQMVVTDRRGYAVFRNIGAGAHSLDATDLRNPGKVATGDSLVRVDGGAALRAFQIRMMPGSRVRGSVRMLARATGSGPNGGVDGETGLDNIVLRLQSAADTLYLVTDPNGNFDAGRVPAGQWSLSYVGGSLPALYSFEQSHVEFMVVAGEDRHIRLVVRPKHRDIQMIASGEVLVMERTAPVARRAIAAEPVQPVMLSVAMRGRPVQAADPSASATTARPVEAALEPAPSAHAGTTILFASAAWWSGSRHTGNAASTLGNDVSSRRSSPALAYVAPGDRPHRSPEPLPWHHTATPLHIRTGAGEDPPDRPPPQRARIPWLPPPREDGRHWKPPSVVGRSPPGRQLILQDPPPTRARPPSTG